MSIVRKPISWIFLFLFVLSLAATGSHFWAVKKWLKNPPGLRELKTSVPSFIDHLHDHSAPDPILP
ncbi:hypothetical protein HZA44_01620 [Candidatus Peregrinibacteria bacterium]|nr:hypothetical protein [Candidatus Peregrinibacteria bacterium]